ncbi:MAG: ChaN family lipoprotein [Pseudomonadota bacterium]
MHRVRTALPDCRHRRPARGWRWPALALAMLVAACAAPTPSVDRVAPVAGAPQPAGLVWDVARGEAIAPATLVDRLADADIAVLGDRAGNPAHHIRQAWLVAALDPVGVAVGAVPQGSENGIAVFRAEGGAPGDIGPAIGWARLGVPDWVLYRPIFEAAANAAITGGRQPRAVLARAMRDGAAAAYGPGAAQVGLTQQLPPGERAARDADIGAALCEGLPADQVASMIEALRFRDARLADAALRARAKGIDRDLLAGATRPARAVLIAGNSNARRDRGVPAYLASLAPGLRVATLGQIEVRAGALAPEAYPDVALYDYVWFSAPFLGPAARCGQTQPG